MFEVIEYLGLQAYPLLKVPHACVSILTVDPESIDLSGIECQGHGATMTKKKYEDETLSQLKRYQVIQTGKIIFKTITKEILIRATGCHTLSPNWRKEPKDSK